MRAEAASLDGVWTFRPTPHHDERGTFVRTFTADVFAAAGVEPGALVQHNQSRSRRGVLRGIHLRVDPGEGKLVRCAHGRVFDVAVDLRPGSESFLRWESFVLDDEEHLQVWLPPGIGHGFLVLSDEADVCYTHTSFHGVGRDLAVRWDDPRIGVDWPARPTILSERDANAAVVDDLLDELAAWRPAAS